MRVYAKALEGVQAQTTNIGSDRTIPGSFNALCVAYYRSADFHDLRASTQSLRRNIIERFRAQHGDKPIAKLTRAMSPTSSATCGRHRPREMHDASVRPRFSRVAGTVQQYVVGRLELFIV
jgi:hypothetical protein